jgi:hypothetical protein
VVLPRRAPQACEALLRFELSRQGVAWALGSAAAAALLAGGAAHGGAAEPGAAGHAAGDAFGACAAALGRAEVLAALGGAGGEAGRAAAEAEAARRAAAAAAAAADARYALEVSKVCRHPPPLGLRCNPPGALATTRRMRWPPPHGTDTLPPNSQLPTTVFEPLSRPQYEAVSARSQLEAQLPVVVQRAMELRSGLAGSEVPVARLAALLASRLGEAAAEPFWCGGRW